MFIKHGLWVLIILMVVSDAAGQAGKEPVTSRDQKRQERRQRINQLIRQEEEGEMVFNKQSVFGFKMNTDGYGFSYELGKFRSNRKVILYQFEFNEKRHPKEKKISLFDGFAFSNITFGKINNFYQFKMGVAQQARIGGKGNKNGVAVSGILGAGLSLGLMKPYYVNVANNSSTFRSTFPKIIDSSYEIIGAAGFTSGWKDVKMNPGAHGKAALRFDYGRFNETISAIEVGLMGEFYSQKVPQLAYVSQNQFFFNAYLSVVFGRRR